MALVTPLLFMIAMGVAELGNYFYNEHTLVKAVRDGARFAARQDFSNYTSCSGDVPTPGTAGPANDNTKNVVMYGYLSGSNVLTPNIVKSNITVTTSCATSVSSQSMSGIYSGRSGGAQIVTVSATVNYRPIIGVALGLPKTGLSLNASSQAAVIGI